MQCSVGVIPPVAKKEQKIYDHNAGPKKKGAKIETPEGYEAFIAYLELGRDRTFDKAAKIVGIAFTTARDLAHRFSWTERAAAYDADQMRDRFKEVKKEDWRWSGVFVQHLFCVVSRRLRSLCPRIISFET